MADEAQSGPEERKTERKYEGVEISTIIRPVKIEQPQEENGNLISLHAAIGKIVDRPDILLEMPRLPKEPEEIPEGWEEFTYTPEWVTESEEEKAAAAWLSSVGIQDVQQVHKVDDLSRVFSFSPEVRRAAEETGRISTKDLLEAIRAELASQIFAQRKFREARELLAEYVSPEVVTDEPIVVAIEGFSDVDRSAFIGRIRGNIWFELNLATDHRNVDPYIDPYHTFNEAREASITWLAGHELIHAWMRGLFDPVEIRGYDPDKAISDHDLESRTKLQISYDLEEEARFIGREQATLCDAIGEGIAVYTETLLAHKEIKKAKAAGRPRHFIETLRRFRGEIYQSHRYDFYFGAEDEGKKRYFYGFYQIFRKIRSRVKKIERILEIVSLIDQPACEKIELDSDEAAGLIENPLNIPLLVGEKNQYRTVGELIGASGW